MQNDLFHVLNQLLPFYACLGVAAWFFGFLDNNSSFGLSFSFFFLFLCV